MHIKVYHFFKFSAISFLKIEVSEAITQIGELAKTSLSDVAKDEANLFHGNKYYGMRNRIVHG